MAPSTTCCVISKQGGLPHPELIDGRGYVPAFTSDQVRSIVEWLRSAGKAGARGPTAVVVGSDLGYGMMRMLEILVDDVCEVWPFRSIIEAEGWLAETQHTSSKPTEAGQEERVCNI